MTHAPQPAHPELWLIPLAGFLVSLVLLWAFYEIATFVLAVIADALNLEDENGAGASDRRPR